MSLRTLIVDDEALARSRVRKLLGTEPDVEVVGEASNGLEAVALIREKRPALVFLDVQMPEVSGFDVLRALGPEELPAVIFVTAHDQHAVAAFEVHALDYLLKPLTQARFKEALEHARQQMAKRANPTLEQLRALLESSPTGPPYLSRLAVRTGSQTLFIKVEDVVYVESAANYVVLHTGQENHILRETITNLESRLPPRLFLRISRSTLVNVEHVKGLQYGSHGEYLLLLQDSKQLVMTRSVREVQERLQFSSSSPPGQGSVASNQ